MRHARRSRQVTVASRTKGMRGMRMTAIQRPSPFVDRLDARIVCAARDRVEECGHRDGPGQERRMERLRRETRVSRRGRRRRQRCAAREWVHAGAWGQGRNG
jgi:hypothetical protein